MRISENGDPEPLVRTLYRFRHDLVMIGRACAKPLPQPVTLRLRPSLEALRREVTGGLRGLSGALAGHTPPPPLYPAFAAIKAFGGELDACGTRIPH